MDAYSLAIAGVCFVLGFELGRATRRFHDFASTSAKEVEVRVAERTEAMQSLYEAQSKFLTDIAHALQTPIAILRGNVEILERGAPRGRTREVVRVIRATLDSMARLVASILESAKLKFAQNKLHRTEFVVEQFIEEIYDDCAVLCKDQDVAFSYVCATGVLAVSADRDRLKEVLLNLISNALKHTPSGGTIAIAATAAPEDFVVIAVRDTGCGIPAEKLPHLFERFYRIESDVTPGTGIGLHIAKQIVEAHGGTIAAESEVGAGSCFTVRIPRAGGGDLV